MATGQISRCRRLVAANLAGENAEVLWESEGEEVSASAKEEVFGLEEDPRPPNRSLGAIVSLHQISRRRRLVAADLAGENAKELRESEGEEASAAAEEELFGLEFIGRFSLSLAQPLKNSHRRQKLSPPKEDLWPPNRSLGVVVSLHQISRRHRLVAAFLAGENAIVLRESEGEEASAAAEGEVFGLEITDGNLLLYSGDKRIHGHQTDLSAPSSHCIRSLGGVVSLQQILPEKTQKCFGRVKEKKPPPPRKRKCWFGVYWSLLSLSLNLSNTLIGGKNSHNRRRIHGHRTDLSSPLSRCIRSLGAVVSLQQNLPEKTEKCFGRVKEKKPPPPRKRKVFGLEISERNL
ncbi:uncharacterized protein G2W53_007842 [Senna tora]|uniref:Uncharacterized protein n=1 Tax=Senna tora TaxID=362788 RepID=A0A834X7F6_9FABA|nr:uncharacterized protein G2W53_007842 [Senna tora]